MPAAAPPSGQTSAYGISQQQTAPQIAAAPFTADTNFEALDASEKIALPSDSRKRLNRVVAVGLLLALLVALFFTWNTATPAASPTSSSSMQQNFTSNTNSTTSANNGLTSNASDSSNTITVYIVGAVNHPGVYNLPANARVYQLIQAAGGPQPDANLVALNLASKLTDGEEIYVIHIGEVPPTYYGGVPQPGTGDNTGSNTSPTGNGQLININTASADQMRQALHISSTTAQNIINYRTQNGPFTSVDQLQQVVSQSIYNKIKDEVTV